MSQIPDNYTPHPEYAGLPDAIKHMLTEKEFAWLGDHGRSKLMEDYCYPDPEEFDVE